ncbi:MAG: hypothetical protein HY922_10560 [Elusimicrobia bacterium]|nr:hypothetical protein [Elusimicrobiota bacterium]
MKARNVNDIRKRFHREWLLIAVESMDPRTQEPLSGRLLAHSPHRDEVDARFVKAKGLACMIYSDKNLPKGYAIAFRA